jgi:hypothetical protein
MYVAVRAEFDRDAATCESLNLVECYPDTGVDFALSTYVCPTPHYEAGVWCESPWNTQTLKEGRWLRHVQP